MLQMQKYLKFLKKLDPKERERLLAIIDQLASNNFEGLDLSKMQGYSNMFRVRKGRIRIVFRMEQSKSTIYRIDFRGNVY